MSVTTTYSAFPFRMPVAFQGTITRAEHATVEGLASHASTPPLIYGGAVMLDVATGKGRAPIAGDGLTGVAFYGLFARPNPIQSTTWAADGLGVFTAPPLTPTNIINVMRRGYMQVQLQNGTAVKGGKVYARWQNATVSLFIGGIETALGTDCFPIPNCYFMGPADTLGGTEIALFAGP